MTAKPAIKVLKVKLGFIVLHSLIWNKS